MFKKRNAFVVLLSGILTVSFAVDSLAATTRTKTVSKTTASGSAKNRTYTTQSKSYVNGRQVSSGTTRTTVKRK